MNTHNRLQLKCPFKVIITIITLWAFVSNSIAWAAPVLHLRPANINKGVFIKSKLERELKSGRYDVIKLEKNREVLLPLILPVEFIQQNAREFSIKLKKIKTNEFNKLGWLISFNQKKIGEIIIYKTIGSRGVYIKAYENNIDILEKWVNSLYEIAEKRKITAQITYEQKQKHKASKQEMETVFQHIKEMLEKYPFLQKNNRDIDLIQKMININIKTKLLNTYQRILEQGIIKKGESFNVLDVGCGQGSLLNDIKKQVNIKNMTLTGIDPAATFSKKFKGIDFRQGFAETLPKEWTNKFHFITSIESIGFMTDPARALEQMFRVLAPGGIMLVEFNTNFDFYFKENLKHESWFTDKELIRLLKMGYGVESDLQNFFILEKSKYDPQIVFPVIYKKSLYSEIKSKKIINMFEKRVGKENPSSPQILQSFKLYRGAMYKIDKTVTRNNKLKNLFKNVKKIVCPQKNIEEAV